MKQRLMSWHRFYALHGQMEEARLLLRLLRTGYVALHPAKAAEFLLALNLERHGVQNQYDRGGYCARFYIWEAMA